MWRDFKLSCFKGILNWVMGQNIITAPTDDHLGSLTFYDFFFRVKFESISTCFNKRIPNHPLVLFTDKLITFTKVFLVFQVFSLRYQIHSSFSKSVYSLHYSFSYSLQGLSKLADRWKFTYFSRICTIDSLQKF